MKERIVQFFKKFTVCQITETDYSIELTLIDAEGNVVSPRFIKGKRDWLAVNHEVEIGDEFYVVPAKGWADFGDLIEGHLGRAERIRREAQKQVDAELEQKAMQETMAASQKMADQERVYSGTVGTTSLTDVVAGTGFAEKFAGPVKRKKKAPSR